MTVQYSTAVRIGMLDSIETTIGPNARIVFYSGAKPTKCSSTASATVIATMVLTGNSGDWMAAASADGSEIVTKLKNGASTWSATAAAGTITHYRIYDSTLTVCHEQGTVALTGGDINLDSVTPTAGQTITITGKTITAGNA